MHKWIIRAIVAAAFTSVVLGVWMLSVPWALIIGGGLILADLMFDVGLGTREE